MPRKSNFLDTDETSFENNLRFVRDELGEEFDQFISNASGENLAPSREYKVVTPKPGFCVKSFRINNNEKYFINVCQTDEIPAPKDISDRELTEILQSDAPSSFRVPMSISEPRTTHDKSKNVVEVCDIAINPQFFTKCKKSLLFQDFFLALIAEAISDKYNVQIDIKKLVILNNRKVMGNIVQHRVRNSDVKRAVPTEDARSNKPDAPIIEELKSTSTELKMPVAKTNSTMDSGLVMPAFQLRGKLNGERVEEILAEFYLPKCISSKDITLDIGEDRIRLESNKYGYKFDKFINDYALNPEHAGAVFDKTHKMLQLKVPVVWLKDM